MVFVCVLSHFRLHADTAFEHFLFESILNLISTVFGSEGKIAGQSCKLQLNLFFLQKQLISFNQVLARGLPIDHQLNWIRTDREVRVRLDFKYGTVHGWNQGSAFCHAFAWIYGPARLCGKHFWNGPDNGGDSRPASDQFDHIEADSFLLQFFIKILQQVLEFVDHWLTNLFVLFPLHRVR